MGLTFRTGQRAPWAAPFHSASFIGLAIAERRDREKTKRERRVPRGPGPARYAEAREWAVRVGFGEGELDRAVACALWLRRTNGPGTVTAEAVRRAMRGTG